MKSQIIFLFAALFFTSGMTSSQYFTLGEDDKTNHTITPEWDGPSIVNWYIAGSRGLWVGFVSGIYNINEAIISEHCLNKETTARIYKIIDAFTSLDIGELFHSILDSTQIINNINECEFESVFNSIVNYCEKYSCTPEKVLSNVVSKVFTIIDKVNEIAQNIQEDPYMTDEEINAECFKIGKDIGAVIRMILGIQYL